MRNFEYFALGLVTLAVIIFITTASCQKVRAYSSDTMTRPYSRFEGMSEYHAASPPSNVTPPTATSEHLDIFASATGDASCGYKSSGLSNSRGPLCLSDELIRTLRTRGFNATGSPDSLNVTPISS